MIRGGGEKSLWSVCRKDCGKQRLQHPWSLALGWGGTVGRTDVQAAGMGAGLWVIQEGAGSALRSLGSVFHSWTVAWVSPP